jgi:hypothetical protein
MRIAAKKAMLPQASKQVLSYFHGGSIGFPLGQIGRRFAPADSLSTAASVSAMRAGNKDM